MTIVRKVCSHPIWWLFCLLSIAASPQLSAVTPPSVTQVTGIVFRADGTPAAGQVIVSWPPFTSADNSPIAGGTKSVTLAPDGTINISLFPTVGATPSGTVYTVVVKSQDGTTSTERWNVPALPTASVSTIRVNTAASMTQSASLNLQSTLSTKLGRQGDTPVTLGGIRFASEFPGNNVPDKISSAISDCKGARCVVIIPSSMDPGGPSKPGDNVSIIDLRGNEAHQKDIAFLSRWTSPGAFVSDLRISADAYRGGRNDFNGVSGTKTQYAGLRLEDRYRTIGERKDITQDMWCLGKGDCIGYFNTVRDLGGRDTAGDEGEEGIRVSAEQGIGNLFPSGTASSVSGNKVTATWQNAFTLGEHRPLINTSRGSYSSGTLMSAGMTSPCTITGSGTGWSSLGNGSHSDLFLEIVPLSNSNGLKYVVPILSITDDTHLVVEYALAEYGDSCLGTAVTSGAAYNIYHGGIVTSLDDPISGGDPSSVNLAVSASMFQPGDTIQQPLGYNIKSVAFSALVSQQIGPGQGYGGEIQNMGPVKLETGLRIFGDWNYGIRLDGNNGALIRSSGTQGALIDAFGDRTTPLTHLIVLQSKDGAMRDFIYDRTNDRYYTTGGLYFDGPTAHIAQGAAPQPSFMYWMQWNDTKVGGLMINAPASANQPLLTASVTGVPRFVVDSSTAVYNNGVGLKGYSSNYSGQTWSINSSNGQASFAKVCYNSAQTVCDYAGAGVPTGTCATGSTYRRTDGTAGATFYVCEASVWAAK